MTVKGAPRERVDLAEVAADVQASMSQHAESAGVRLEVERIGDTTGHSCVVLGSTSALRRAIASLVDNALAHQHPGGTVTIRVEHQRGHVVTAVRDDGIGLDPDAIGTLFDRFSHGHTHTVAGGHRRYGIGLALVREIAHAHHGDISASQTPGGGATFTLTLPAAS
jgi:signal transduction histidine kinase